MNGREKKDPATELRRGALELALLSYLQKEPAFGGGIISGLTQQTNGGLTLTEGALYPALHRLEKNGVLSSEWRDGPPGHRKRKYYHLTESGKDRLVELTTAWKALSEGMDRLLGDE